MVIPIAGGVVGLQFSDGGSHLIAKGWAEFLNTGFPRVHAWRLDDGTYLDADEADGIVIAQQVDIDATARFVALRDAEQLWVLDLDSGDLGTSPRHPHSMTAHLQSPSTSGTAALSEFYLNPPAGLRVAESAALVGDITALLVLGDGTVLGGLPSGRIATWRPTPISVYTDEESAAGLEYLRLTGDPVTIPSMGDITSLAPDGEYLLAGSDSGQIAVVDASTFELVLAPTTMGTAEVTDVAIADNHLSAMTVSGEYGTWSLTGRGRLHVPVDRAAEFIIDTGHSIASADAHSAGPATTDTPWVSGRIVAMTPSPDGGLLAIATVEDCGRLVRVCPARISLLAAATGAEVASIRTASARDALAISFSPDGESLAVGTGHGGVTFTHIAEGTSTSTFEEAAARAPYRSISFAGEHAIAAVTHDGSLLIWNIVDGELELLSANRLDATAVSWHPTTGLVVGHNDGAISLRTIDTPHHANETLPSLQGAIQHLSLDASATTLAASDTDSVTVWHLAPHQHLFTIPAARRASLSSDAASLYAAAAATTALPLATGGIWTIEPEGATTAACQVAPTPIDADTWQRELPEDEPYSATCSNP